MRAACFATRRTSRSDALHETWKPWNLQEIVEGKDAVNGVEELGRRANHPLAEAFEVQVRAAAEQEEKVVAGGKRARATYLPAVFWSS